MNNFTAKYYDEPIHPTFGGKRPQKAPEHKSEPESESESGPGSESESESECDEHCICIKYETIEQAELRRRNAEIKILKDMMSDKTGQPKHNVEYDDEDDADDIENDINEGIEEEEDEDEMW